MCKFIYKQLVCSWYCRDRVVPLERMGLHSEEGYNDDQTEGRHASSLTIRILYFFFFVVQILLTADNEPRVPYIEQENLCPYYELRK